MKKSTLRCRIRLKYAENRVFLIASFFLLLFAVTELLVHLHTDRFPRSQIFRIVLSLLICALFYLGGCLYADRTKDRIILFRLMPLFFAVYLYLILDFTLLDKGLGRADRLQYDRADYLRLYVNFRPFQSIYGVYICGFRNGYVSAYYLILNLLGNICAFMPFAFFLPLFFKAQRHWYVFCTTMIVTVGAIETLQFAFMLGSCDVDDLILNVGGAVILYFLLRIRRLQPFLARFVGLYKEKEA